MSTTVGRICGPAGQTCALMVPFRPLSGNEPVGSWAGAFMLPYNAQPADVLGGTVQTISELHLCGDGPAVGLTHRLLWPVVKRPIYAANRKGLIKNTNLLGALGTMLLFYAFPNNPVVKWLTDFLPKLKG